MGLKRLGRGVYTHPHFSPRLWMSRYVLYLYCSLCLHGVLPGDIYLTRIRGSSGVITTRYGLDGPGIESWWGEIFRTRPDRPWGLPRLLCKGYRVFPGDKSAEVKERVEPYFYSPFGSPRPGLGWTLTFLTLSYWIFGLVVILGPRMYVFHLVKAACIRYSVHLCHVIDRYRKRLWGYCNI
jgi:hypothetical protein